MNLHNHLSGQVPLKYQQHVSVWLDKETPISNLGNNSPSKAEKKGRRGGRKKKIRGKREMKKREVKFDVQRQFFLSMRAVIDCPVSSCGKIAHLYKTFSYSRCSPKHGFESS